MKAECIEEICLGADHSTNWMTGPTNVQARRIAPTVLEVTWDRPPYSAILGYRIYYDVYPEKEMEQWETTEVCCSYFYVAAVCRSGNGLRLVSHLGI